MIRSTQSHLEVKREREKLVNMHKAGGITTATLTVIPPLGFLWVFVTSPNIKRIIGWPLLFPTTT